MVWTQDGVDANTNARTGNRASSQAQAKLPGERHCTCWQKGSRSLGLAVRDVPRCTEYNSPGGAQMRLYIGCYSPSLILMDSDRFFMHREFRYCPLAATAAPWLYYVWPWQEERACAGIEIRQRVSY